MSSPLPLSLALTFAPGYSNSDRRKASSISALLLGTDFSQRIKNVGPQRALKFIREHGSIERVIERERKYSPRISEKSYLKQVEIARLVFQTLPPVPDTHLLQAKESDIKLVSDYTAAVWFLYKALIIP